MKILSAAQIKDLDAYTIAHEPIASIDLMERAANACVKRLYGLIKHDDAVLVLCGTGNNGGDGLAIARLLLDRHFTCLACVVLVSEKMSADAELNYTHLKELYPTQVLDITEVEQLSALEGPYTVAVDALFGTGLNKAVTGLGAEVIDFVNAHFSKIISIDVPSGLFVDEQEQTSEKVVRATLTLSLQLPKLAFLLAQNQTWVPAFELLDIGLHPEGVAKLHSEHYYVTGQLIASLLKKRNPFSHKGTYGHALLVAGSKGKNGAAIIAAKACLRSGAGLLTLHSTADTTTALMHHLPEAMTELDPHADYVTELHKPERFDAIGFGPGLGQEEDSALVLKKILHTYAGRLVIDADGLNILSENKTWLEFLPPDTILTPHPKEFERLTEKHHNDYDCLKALKLFSRKHRCLVILKGTFSAIAMPDGNVFFNSTGNAGLAKGGSGDALTGMILGLLSRGYNAPQAALIGTYLHGYAADLCVKKTSQESLLISDVIEMLPKAFKKMETWKKG